MINNDKWEIDKIPHLPPTQFLQGPCPTPMAIFDSNIHLASSHHIWVTCMLYMGQWCSVNDRIYFPRGTSFCKIDMQAHQNVMCAWWSIWLHIKKPNFKSWKCSGPSIIWDNHAFIIFNQFEVNYCMLFSGPVMQWFHLLTWPDRHNLHCLQQMVPVQHMRPFVFLAACQLWNRCVLHVMSQPGHCAAT